MRATNPLSLNDPSPIHRVISFPHHYPQLMTDQDWKEHYPNLETLGQGAFARVFAKENKALKVNVFDFSNSDSVATMREALILSKLDHPNIIKMHRSGFVRKDQRIFFEMEMPLYESYHPWQSLSHWARKSFLYDMALTLDYIHTKDIAHQDLKPQNIMRDTHNDLYILGDWGSAGLQISDEEKKLHGSIAWEKTTSWYRSFEKVLGDQRWAKKGDIWALAVAYLHTFHKGNFFKPKIDPKDTADQINMKLLTAIREAVIRDWNGNGLNSNSQTPWEALSGLETGLARIYPDMSDLNEIQLLEAMLDLNPERRISAAEILKHPFLNGVSARRQLQAEQRAVFERNAASAPESSKKKTWRKTLSLSRLFRSSAKKPPTSPIANVYRADQDLSDIDPGRRKRISDFLQKSMVPEYNISDRRKVLWNKQVDTVTEIASAFLKTPQFNNDDVLAIFYALVMTYDWSDAFGDAYDPPGVDLLLSVEAKSKGVANFESILDSVIEIYPSIHLPERLFQRH